MTRWIVVFRSHVEAPADVHYVGIEAPSALRAVRDAQREAPPPDGWVLVEAVAWPAGVDDIDEAIAVVA